MKKAKKINGTIIVFDKLPLKWDGITSTSENDYYELGFKDYIKPVLLQGQCYGNMFENLVDDNFSIEVVAIPSLLNSQKLGVKVKDPETGVFNYTIVEKNSKDLIDEEDTVNHNILMLAEVLEMSKLDAAKKFDDDIDIFITRKIGAKGYEYKIAEEEAAKYKSSKYTGTVPLSVLYDSKANNCTNKISCNRILKMASNWKKVIMSIRSKRLMSKANIKKAELHSEIDLVIIDWNNFCKNVLGAL